MSALNTDMRSLAHTKWNCKYHIVFAPEYRRKVFFEEKRSDIREILRQLCQWKGVEIIEGEICPDHIHILDRTAPDFAMFGIGDYSYSKYKVGISGFYKEPVFSLMYSENKPVMSDDTCYFISFDNYDMAYVAMIILNSSNIKQFLKNIAFLDSKRPYTKKVLERISFEKILKDIKLESLISTEKNIGLPRHMSKELLKKIFSLPELNKAKQLTFNYA